MKKSVKTFLVLTLLFMCTVITAYAASGDLVGQALHTDITAYINHYALPTYSVNNQTVVFADDLVNFGFDSIWSESEKTLYLALNTNKDIVPFETVSKTDKPGSVFSDILESNITVYVNGISIPAYALNGYVCIPFDELKFIGLMNWEEEQRAIKLWIDGLPINPSMQPISYEKVLVYNLNLEEKAIYPSEVEAYAVQGWYKYESFICHWARKLANEQGCEAAIAYLENKIRELNGYPTYYYYTRISTDEQIKTLEELYSSWYKELGVPLIIVGSYISYNSIGVPEANIQFWNVSGKDVASFEVKFVCYDAYGNVTTDYSWYNGSFLGYCDNARMELGEKSTKTWTLYNNERTKSVRNIVLQRVAFTDGTIWKR